MPYKKREDLYAAQKRFRDKRKTASYEVARLQLKFMEKVQDRSGTLRTNETEWKKRKDGSQ